MNVLQRLEWRINKELKRLRLKNRRPSIIASNCIGTFIYYDMKLQFCSPTINLSFNMNDYVLFLERIEWYLSQPIIPCELPDFDCPCGRLGDIVIRFNHYNSIEQAIKKWEERKRRIDWNNIYVFGVDGDECTYESLKRFDSLPYENKVIFTHKPYPEFSSAYYIPGYENCLGVQGLTDFKDQFLIRRKMDQFDYVSFLNKNIRSKHE